MQWITAAKKITALAVAFTFVLSPAQFSFAQQAIDPVQNPLSQPGVSPEESGNNPDLIVHMAQGSDTQTDDASQPQVLTVATENSTGVESITLDVTTSSYTTNTYSAGADVNLSGNTASVKISLFENENPTPTQEATITCEDKCRYEFNGLSPETEYKVTVSLADSNITVFDADQSTSRSFRTGSAGTDPVTTNETVSIIPEDTSTITTADQTMDTGITPPILYEETTSSSPTDVQARDFPGQNTSIDYTGGTTSGYSYSFSIINNDNDTVYRYDSNGSLVESTSHSQTVMNNLQQMHPYTSINRNPDGSFTVEDSASYYRYHYDQNGYQTGSEYTYTYYDTTYYYTPSLSDIANEAMSRDFSGSSVFTDISSGYTNSGTYYSFSIINYNNGDTARYNESGQQVEYIPGTTTLINQIQQNHPNASISQNYDGSFTAEDYNSYYRYHYDSYGNQTGSEYIYTYYNPTTYVDVYSFNIDSVGTDNANISFYTSGSSSDLILRIKDQYGSTLSETGLYCSGYCSTSVSGLGSNSYYTAELVSTNSNTYVSGSTSTSFQTSYDYSYYYYSTVDVSYFNTDSVGETDASFSFSTYSGYSDLRLRVRDSSGTIQSETSVYCYGYCNTSVSGLTPGKDYTAELVIPDYNSYNTYISGSTTVSFQTSPAPLPAVLGEEEIEARKILAITPETQPAIYKTTMIHFECGTSPCGMNATDSYQSADGTFLGSRNYDSTLGEASLLSSDWYDKSGTKIDIDRLRGMIEAAEYLDEAEKAFKQLPVFQLTLPPSNCNGDVCTDVELPVTIQYYDADKNLLGHVVVSSWNENPREWFGPNGETLSIDDRKLVLLEEVNLGNTGITLHNNAGTLNYDPNTRTATITALNGTVTVYKNAELFGVDFTSCTLDGCDSFSAMPKENILAGDQVATFTRQQNFGTERTEVTGMIVYANVLPEGYTLVGADEAAIAATALRLNNASLVHSKQVEIHENFCLAMSCPIAGSTTKYFDENGNPVGSKVESVYRNDMIEATTNNFVESKPETRTEIRWYDAQGQELLPLLPAYKAEVRSKSALLEKFPDLNLDAATISTRLLNSSDLNDGTLIPDGFKAVYFVEIELGDLNFSYIAGINAEGASAAFPTQTTSKINPLTERATDVAAILGSNPVFKIEETLNDGGIKTTYFAADGSLLGSKTVLKPDEQTTVTTWRGAQGNTKQITTTTIDLSGNTETTLQDSTGKLIFAEVTFADGRRSTTLYSYDTYGNMLSLRTSISNGSGLLSEELKDFSHAMFNDQGMIVAGHVNSITVGANGNIQSTAVETYSGNGNLSMIEIVNYDFTGVTIASKETKDFSGAIFDDQGMIVGGSVTSITLHADGTPLKTTVETYGSDGSVILVETTDHAAIAEMRATILAQINAAIDDNAALRNDLLANLEERLAQIHQLAEDFEIEMSNLVYGLQRLVEELQAVSDSALFNDSSIESARQMVSQIQDFLNSSLEIQKETYVFFSFTNSSQVMDLKNKIGARESFAHNLQSFRELVEAGESMDALNALLAEFPQLEIPEMDPAMPPTDPHDSINELMVLGQEALTEIQKSYDEMVAMISQQILEAVMREATNAGVNYAQEPKINVLSVSINKDVVPRGDFTRISPEPVYNLKITYNIDSGETFNALATVADNSNEIVALKLVENPYQQQLIENARAELLATIYDMIASVGDMSEEAIAQRLAEAYARLESDTIDFNQRLDQARAMLDEQIASLNTIMSSAHLSAETRSAIAELLSRVEIYMQNESGDGLQTQTSEYLAWIQGSTVGMAEMWNRMNQDYLQSLQDFRTEVLNAVSLEEISLLNERIPSMPTMDATAPSFDPTEMLSQLTSEALALREQADKEAASWHEMLEKLTIKIESAVEDAAIKAGLSYTQAPKIKLLDARMGEDNSVSITYNIDGGQAFHANAVLAPSSKEPMSLELVENPFSAAIDEFRNNILSNLNAAQEQNEQTLAVLRERLNNLPSELQNFDNESNQLATNLKDLMIEIRSLMNRTPHILVVGPVDEKLLEMQAFLDHDFENQKNDYQETISTWVNALVDAYETYAQKLAQHQADTMSASTMQRLQELDAQFPQPVVMSQAQMRAPREALNQFIAEANQIIAQLTPKIPEGHMALEEGEEDLVKAQLGLDADVKINSKTVSTEAFNCDSEDCEQTHKIITTYYRSIDGETMSVGRREQDMGGPRMIAMRLFDDQGRMILEEKFENHKEPVMVPAFDFVTEATRILGQKPVYQLKIETRPSCSGEGEDQVCTQVMPQDTIEYFDADKKSIGRVVILPWDNNRQIWYSPDWVEIKLLPENAVTIVGPEQDLALRALGLNTAEIGTVYKTTERTTVNCVTTPCDLTDIITDKIYTQDGKVIGFKVVQDDHVSFYAADENGSRGEMKQSLDLVKDKELSFVKTLLMDKTEAYRGAFWTMWEQMRTSLTPIYTDQEEEDERRKRLQQSSIG